MITQMQGYIEVSNNHDESDIGIDELEARVQRLLQIKYFLSSHELTSLILNFYLQHENSSKHPTQHTPSRQLSSSS